MEASRHVLGATGCSKFVFTAERRRQIEELRMVDPNIQAWEIPGLWGVFDRSEIHPGPVKGKTVPDEEERVAVYIHSSGTTGMMLHFVCLISAAMILTIICRFA